MPSPFPGMDPYLENPDFWQGFHNRFMTYACDAIQPRLPANYVATLEMRIYVEREFPNGQREERVPDVEVIRTAQPKRARGTAAVAEGAPPGIRGYWIYDPPIERREAFINIRSLPGEELITSLELLSPTNKRPGKGRTQYERKQRETVDAGVNLVEIDLVRGGHHTVAVDEDLLSDLPPYAYLACVFRAARDWGYEVFAWTLRDSLPEIPVPLAPEDPELTLNLQALFTQTYDNGRFHRLLRYARNPTPRFAPDDAAWADDLLRGAGYRSGDA